MSNAPSTALRPRRIARVTGVLGAAAAAVAMTFATALPASAAPNLDTDETGSITIHKLEEPATPSGLDHDGSEVDTSSLTPIDGVTYAVQHVGGLDLETNAGWEALDGLTADAVLADAATYPLTDVASAVTGAAGVAGEAIFDGLPLGVYLVTETDLGDNGIAFAAEPFLVSVPLPLEGDWLYDVHVYPKNTVVEITKDVDDSAANVLGDVVTWTIETSVPSLPADAALTAFGITDQVDDRLQVVLDDVEVTVDGLTLADGDVTVTEVDGLLTVVFNDLEALRTVQGATVTVVVPTEVVAIGDGTITNDAAVYVNDPSNTFESDEVQTQWGALQVIKHEGDDQDARLEGAEFALYLASDTELTTPIATGTTNDDGEWVVEGLKAGDYLLVETAAPLGYVLDDEPIAITITAGSVEQALVQYVSNAQTPPFTLPLTGGAGAFMFLLGGGALLALGVAMAMRRKRAAVAA